jgi:hypothetical protein
MNTIVKIGVASALAFGYASAHAAISQPATGSSDLILFAEIINSTTGSVVSSYARDTGISIDSVFPSGSLNPSGTAVPLSTGFTNISLPSGINVAADANMTAFLAQDTTGNVLEWSVQAGEYANGDGSTTNLKVTGNGKFLTTSQQPVTVITGKNVGNLAKWANIDGTVTSLNTNITSGSSVLGTSAAAAGIWDPQAGNTNVAGWFGGNGPLTYPGLLTDQRGATQALYGVTGNGGSATTKIQVYSLGNFTLTADGALTTPTVSSVPIPAALWLFGSGLLGLAGVGRRKAVQAA